MNSICHGQKCELNAPSGREGATLLSVQFWMIRTSFGSKTDGGLILGHGGSSGAIRSHWSKRCVCRIKRD